MTYSDFREVDESVHRTEKAESQQHRSEHNGEQGICNGCDGSGVVGHWEWRQPWAKNVFVRELCGECKGTGGRS